MGTTLATTIYAVYRNSVMSAHLYKSVSIWSRNGAPSRQVYCKWSIVERPGQATNEYAPPPPHGCQFLRR